MNFSSTYSWFVNNVNDIRSWVTFGADISILLITIYTFYFTFISRKIAVLSYGKSLGNAGENYHVMLENKTLSPIAIKKVSMIIDNKWKVTMKEYDIPLIIQPFSVELVEQNKYGFMENEDKFKKNKIVFEIMTTSKNLYIPFQKKFIKTSRNMKQMPHNCMAIANYYGDTLLLHKTKYVLNVYYDSKFKDVIQIFETGLMTGDINTINALKVNDINDKEEVVNLLNQIIKDTKFSVQLIEHENMYPK